MNFRVRKMLIKGLLIASGVVAYQTPGCVISDMTMEDLLGALNGQNASLKAHFLGHDDQGEDDQGDVDLDDQGEDEDDGSEND